MTEELKRLTEEIPELEKFYKVVDRVRSQELIAANKETKIAHTRMRNALSEVNKLTVIIRKKLLSRAKNL